VNAHAARPLKRQRATKVEMVSRQLAIVRMVAASAPTSVRHVYYQAVTEHLVEKDTKETKRRNYNKIQRAVLATWCANPGAGR
jgi:hypothetical protein